MTIKITTLRNHSILGCYLLAQFQQVVIRAETIWGDVQGVGRRQDIFMHHLNNCTGRCEGQSESGD